MALFDLPLEELRGYRPERAEPGDFDDFWAATLAAARERVEAPRFDPVDTGLATVATFDVTFSGFGGEPIKAWLHLPVTGQGALPCVVEFIGYGGGRGLPHEWLLWSAAGYAHLVVDTRGQGSVWRSGDTADREPGGGNPQVPGFMTRGVLDPASFYYRRLFTDAVRAVETARSHPRVDPARVVVTGVSQGGGVALAVAGLVPDVFAVMPDVPFLCHYRRATEITDSPPYGELARYCRTHRHHEERVFATLAYFDGVNFAPRARAPALFSVGLMDLTCPPSTVFAAYNHYAGPADIRVWRYNDHEGGEAFHQAEQLRFLRGLLTPGG
jgi:cephalosporin-C deacetylase